MQKRIDIFCREMMKPNTTQSDAYRVANPLSKRWKPDTVHNKAYAMMKLDEVKARLKEMNIKVETKIVQEFTKSRLDILRNLETLLEDCKDIEDNKDKIRTSIECLKEQGKLQGYYEAEKSSVANLINVNNLTINLDGEEVD